jgi:hypothetical protein
MQPEDARNDGLLIGVKTVTTYDPVFRPLIEEKQWQGKAKKKLDHKGPH